MSFKLQPLVKGKRISHSIFVPCTEEKTLELRPYIRSHFPLPQRCATKPTKFSSVRNSYNNYIYPIMERGGCVCTHGADAFLILYNVRIYRHSTSVYISTVTMGHCKQKLAQRALLSMAQSQVFHRWKCWGETSAGLATATDASTCN